MMYSLRFRMFLMIFGVVAAVQDMVVFNAERGQRLATQLLSGAVDTFTVRADGGDTLIAPGPVAQARVEARCA